MKAVAKLSHLSLLLWVCSNLDWAASTDPLYGESFQSTFDNRGGDTRVFPTSVNEGSPSYFSENLNFDAIDGKILIGAADKLYVFDKNLEVAEGGEYTWNSSSSRCIQARRYACRNHIRIYQRPNTGDPNSLFVCGTQSGNQPQCRILTVNGSRLIEAGAPNPTRLISPNPDFPSFGDFRKQTPSDSVYFSANFKTSQAMSFDLSFQSVDINSTGGSVTTSRLYGWQEGDNYWLQSPVVFVDFARIDAMSELTRNTPEQLYFYYIFLRERRVSVLSDAPTVSRVIRLCRNDRSVPRNSALISIPNDAQDTIFTSFMKAEIFCLKRRPTSTQFLGAQDFKYNEMWSVAFNNVTGGRFRENDNFFRLAYGAFSAPRNGPTGTAICAYPANLRNDSAGSITGVSGILDVFHSTIDIINPRTANLRENIYHRCESQGRSAADSQLIQMAQLVRQIGDDPLLIMTGFYVTQMVVDQVCIVRRDMSECLNQDILFLGTSDGRILKVVFATDRASRSNVNPVITEEITLGTSDQVKEMKIESDGSAKQLYVVTDVRIYRLPLERCSRHQNFTSCVGSRDPYCVWDTRRIGGCVPSTLSANGDQSGAIPIYLQQNVHTGEVHLPKVGFELASYTTIEGSESRLSITVVSSERVPRGVVQINITDLTAKVGVNVFSSANPIGVFLEGENPPYRMSFEVEARRDGQYFGGNLQFQLTLQNTQFGAVVFTQQNTTVTIQDVDGTLFRIGLANLATNCVLWPLLYNNSAKMLSMEIAGVIGGGYPVNNVVNTTFICARPDDKYVTFTGALLATSSHSTFELLNSLQKWIQDAPEIKSLNNVIVDRACSVQISTPNSTCDAKEIKTGALSSRVGSDSDATVAGLTAGLVLVIVITLCLVVLAGVLVVTLVKTKQSGSFSPNETAKVTPHEDEKRDSLEEPYDVADPIPSPEHGPPNGIQKDTYYLGLGDKPNVETSEHVHTSEQQV